MRDVIDGDEESKLMAFFQCSAQLAANVAGLPVQDLNTISAAYLASRVVYTVNLVLLPAPACDR